MASQTGAPSVRSWLGHLHRVVLLVTVIPPRAPGRVAKVACGRTVGQLRQRPRARDGGLRRAAAAHRASSQIRLPSCRRPQHMLRRAQRPPEKRVRHADQPVRPEVGQRKVRVRGQCNARSQPRPSCRRTRAGQARRRRLPAQLTEGAVRRVGWHRDDWQPRQQLRRCLRQEVSPARSLHKQHRRAAAAAAGRREGALTQGAGAQRRGAGWPLKSALTHCRIGFWWTL